MSAAPAIILVRPQMGENIGAAARAMLNFGLTDMRLVAPRDGWPNPRAEALAAGASDVLKHARVGADLTEAAGDRTFLFATTARARDLTKPVYKPEDAMAEARRLVGQGRRVGVLFGPERSGLDNDDVANANAIVTVPVNPDFPSLNLAQCVLLMGYEWGRRDMERAFEPWPAAASLAEVDRLARHWEERLEAAGFFFPPQKAPHMRRVLRNFWSRMPMSPSDVRLLHGALRQLVRRSDG